MKAPIPFTKSLLNVTVLFDSVFSSKSPYYEERDREVMKPWH